MEPKKKRTKKHPIPREDVEELGKMSKTEKDKIDQLLSQALLRYKNDLAYDKKLKQKEMSYLSTLAEEYLNCFMLVGYSLQNEKVVIFNAHNARDEAAVVDLLRSTFLDIANNRP